MNNIKNEIEQSPLISALTDPAAEDLGANIAELSLDSLLDEGLLKDIPTIGAIVKLFKIGSTIHDKLFLKKVLMFMKGLKDVSVDKRREMIAKIDDSKDYSSKVGEKLLYIIDSCEDAEKSELMGRLFKAYVEEKITYEDFLQTAKVLSLLSISDFRWLISQKQNYHFDLNKIGEKINTGLFALKYDDFQVDVTDKEDKSGRPSWDKYDTQVSGGIDVNLSLAGEVIQKVFNPPYKEQESIKI